jgi:hypothetical protein
LSKECEILELLGSLPNWSGFPNRPSQQDAMKLPKFLLEEQPVRQNGAGPALEVEGGDNRVFAVTLGINQILEQQSLDLAFHGSADGQTWSDKPIVAFPQKFYCGVYTLILDLSDRPEVRYVRAQWKVNRWGRGAPIPLFNIYVFVVPMQEAAMGASV